MEIQAKKLITWRPFPTVSIPWMPAFSLLFILLLLLLAIFAPLVAPKSPTKQSLSDRLKPPVWLQTGSSEYLLGTDRLGRDILSRIIYGSRVSLSVAFLAIFVAGITGAIIGLLSGYLGGIVDTLLMRIVDLFLSLPLILIAIVLAVVVGASFSNVIFVIGLLLWPRYARQVRGETLAIKEQDFVALARIAGVSGSRIVAFHILPNVTPSLLVLATLQVGYVIILEASLSFLGVGVPPPQPTWGSMVAEGRALVTSAWWISFIPGLGIMLVVLAFNLLGDWLRDRLDPKLRQV